MNAVVIGFDVKSFSSVVDNREKKEIRQYLFNLITTATCYQINNLVEDLVDTGDGFYLVLNETDYSKILNLFVYLSSKAKETSKWQIRAVIHIGSVENDDSYGGKPGKIGTGLDSCSRYLDNEYLKAALIKNTDEKLIFGLSDKIVAMSKNETWFNISDYEKYDFTVKTYSGSFYLYKNNIQSLPVCKTEVPSSSIKSILKPDFEEILLQSDFKYKNKKGEMSNLNTFFVFPELTVFSEEDEKEAKIKSNELLETFLESPFNFSLFGDEQCGKTSLCKEMFLILLDTNQFLPIYIRFKVKEKGFLSNKIQDHLKQEYKSYNDEIPKVLILDDFYLLEDYIQFKIINEVRKMNNTYSIIITDKVYRESVEHINLLKGYKTYAIRLLGHLKRNELIDKWLEFNSIPAENYQAIDELSEYISQTLIHGVIPFTPFYILTILAAKDTATPLDTEITSKGYCYQTLVNIGLLQMQITDTSTISSITNFFGYIAFDMYQTRKTDYNEDELENLFIKFEQQFNCNYQFADLLKMLFNSTIFSKNSLNLYSFNGLYFYYYFAARFIAARLTEKFYYDLTRKMIDELYEKENGYIVIFIIHHTRNIVLFDEIQLNAMIAYEEYQEVIIDKSETKAIDESLKDIKQLVVEGTDNSKENRIKRAKKSDQIQEYSEDKDEKVREDSNQKINKEVQRMRKALKTIEVLGQILKNHNGEIEKSKLFECYTNGINSLRRVCKYLLSHMTEHENDLVEIIIRKLEENNKDKKITKAEKEEFAHKIISSINLSFIMDIIQVAGNLLGSKDLNKIIKQMYQKDPCPINFCIYLYCSLWYNKQPPINELRDTFPTFPLAIKTIIRIMIKNYFDMHKIDIKNKQKIAEIVGIKVNRLKIDYSK